MGLRIKKVFTIRPEMMGSFTYSLKNLKSEQMKSPDSI
jgi:hypothetical protein